MYFMVCFGKCAQFKMNAEVKLSEREKIVV